jgi:hypothetical protein
MSTGTTPVFVMPFHGDHPEQLRYLDAAIAGLTAQTDPAWRLVIVDDASGPCDAAHLDRVAAASAGRITVLHQPVNRGQGHCRNVGTAWAAEHGAPFVLFHDADDLSHPRRLAVTRRILDDDPCTDFVYSTFTVVDGDDRPVPLTRVAPSIVEILETHIAAPVQGRDAWIRIATETGYTTLTSTVAVRTGLAVRQPFPEVRGSEDAATWLRMTADGRGLRYSPDIPTRYRVVVGGPGSADRRRLGPDEYARQQVRMNLTGFEEAAAIAVAAGRIGTDEVAALRPLVAARVAVTLRREGQHTLADQVCAMEAAP